MKRKKADIAEIRRIEGVLRCLNEDRLIEPGHTIPGDPVDLRGLEFPTVSHCRHLDLDDTVVNRVCGKQKVYDASLIRVDFSNAVLDHSVWNDCVFTEVLFSDVSLRNVRFFGCRFERCVFRNTNLSDASMSIGRNGKETELLGCRMELCNLRGASCHRLVVADTVLSDCELSDFVFNEAAFSHVVIRGAYDGLTFRGARGEPERNALNVDLSLAEVGWLNVDYGMDLRSTKFRDDGSCLVASNRRQACEAILELARQPGTATRHEAMRLLGAVFSDDSPSPLDPSQTMFYVSIAMLRELGRLGKAEAETILGEIRNRLTRDSLLI